LAYCAQQAFLRAGDIAKVPLAYQVTLDARLLLFTLAVSILAAIVFGLTPAVQITSSFVAASQESRRATAGAAGRNMRRLLAGSEFAIALVLVAGAALLIRSFMRLNDVNPGFTPDHLVTAHITLPWALYRDDKAVVRFWDEFLQRVNSVPGVRSAALSLSLPPNLLVLTNPFMTDRQAYDRSRPPQVAEELSVSMGYFTTLGVPLLAGRDFQPADRESKLAPIIINRTTAEKYFPGQDPIGHKLQTGSPRPDPPNETIIGVVGDVK
jgi:putative ABC transport system permease protein